MIEFHSFHAWWAVNMPGEQGRTKTLGIKWQPEAIPSLRFVDELCAWHRNDGMLVLGTGVTFSDVM